MNNILIMSFMPLLFFFTVLIIDIKRNFEMKHWKIIILGILCLFVNWTLIFLA